METARIEFPDRKQAILKTWREEPPQPAAGQIAGPTIATVYAGLDELAHFAGTADGRVPAVAAVFRADSIGEGVEDIALGSILAATGSHASYQIAHRNVCAPVPENVDPLEAGFSQVLAMTMRVLENARASMFSRTMILGLGLNGHIAALLMQALGRETLAMDPDQQRRGMALSKGIAAYAEPPLAELELAGNVDLALDMSAGELVSADELDMLAAGGELILGTLPWRTQTVDFDEWMEAIFRRGVSVRGRGEFGAMGSRGEAARALRSGLRYLAEGRVDLRDLYKIAAPSDCNSIYGQLLRGEFPALGCVFDWNEFLPF